MISEKLPLKLEESDENQVKQEDSISDHEPQNHIDTTKPNSNLISMNLDGTAPNDIITKSKDYDDDKPMGLLHTTDELELVVPDRIANSVTKNDLLSTDFNDECGLDYTIDVRLSLISGQIGSALNPLSNAGVSKFYSYTNLETLLHEKELINLCRSDTLKELTEGIKRYINNVMIKLNKANSTLTSGDSPIQKKNSLNVIHEVKEDDEFKEDTTRDKDTAPDFVSPLKATSYTNHRSITQKSKFS